MSEWLRSFAVVPLALLAGGCSLVPGITMGPQPGPDGEEPEVHRISGSLVERMAAEQINATGGPATPAGAEDYRYVVGAGDVLSIIVWGHPDLTNPFGQSTAGIEASGRLVREDGWLVFPYVGEVEAAGRTAQAIQRDIREGLRPYVEQPQVTVRVQEFRSQRVYVTGELRNPGILPITDRPLTILDALSRAGGFTDRREQQVRFGADERQALLTRGGETRPIDLHALYRQGVGNEVLRDGDILHVPDDSANKVFVMGEVGRQTSVPLHRGRLSLAEAISEAEGIDLGAADTRQVYVIRGVPRSRDDGEGTEIVPEIYRLDASDAAALLLADTFPLQPRDVVWVATAEIVRWNRVMENIFPTIRAAYQLRLLDRGFD